MKDDLGRRKQRPRDDKDNANTQAQVGITNNDSAHRTKFDSLAENAKLDKATQKECPASNTLQHAICEQKADKQRYKTQIKHPQEGMPLCIVHPCLYAVLKEVDKSQVVSPDDRSPLRGSRSLSCLSVPPA